MAGGDGDMKIISFCSVKGGTGKSTLSILTALTLKAQGARVLFIDLDPQHSGTFFFIEDDRGKSIFDAFMGKSIHSQIVETAYGVDLIPSDLRLLDTRTIETNRLRKLVKGLDYDFLVVDTAPTFDSLTTNAYLASDVIIIPSTVDPFSYKTLHFLFDKLTDLDLKAEIGIVLNLWKAPKTTNETAYSVREANIFLQDEKLKDLILNTAIPRANQLKRVITEKGYTLKGKALEPILSLVNEITGIQLKLDLIGATA